MKHLPLRYSKSKLLSLFPLLSLLGFICLSMQGCKKDPPLRVGLNAWPGYEFIFLAEHLGYYEEEGVEVDIIEFASLADARRSFERGQIDGLGTSVVEVILATAHSSIDRLKITAVVDYSDGADVILGREGLASVKALEGKTVGVEIGSLCLYVLVRALELNGMSLDAIIPRPSDPSSMVEKLNNGELDAIVTYPPFSTELLRDGNVETVFSTHEIKGEVVDVLAFGESVTTKRGKDVQAFHRAFFRAMEFANQNPREAYPVMASRQGISAEEFALAVSDGMKLLDSTEQKPYFENGGMIEKLIKKVEEVMLQVDLIPEEVPVEELYSDQFIRTSSP